MRGQHLFVLTLVFLHLAISVLNNVQQLYAATSQTADSQDTNGLARLMQLPLLSHYAQFTGIHGGYGFFGPSVGSTFHTRIQLSFSDSEEIHTLSDPGLRSRAGKLRYSSFLDINEVFIDSDRRKSTSELNLAKTIKRSLCKRSAERYGASTVHVSILAKSPPSLSSIRETGSLQLHYIQLFNQHCCHEPSEP
ncbi:hypothetical protein [Sphingobacterium pedocola]|uniref:hypothetical protein n=1 Tax=Sphingobacterium pedocola TaxID=2082722 RepID=UPI0018C9752F|nr:hypothetical protein [Sphingobacterium pedocola]